MVVVGHIRMSRAVHLPCFLPHSVRLVSLNTKLKLRGSGSKSNVSMVAVVAMDEQDDAVEVHPLAFRER